MAISAGEHLRLAPRPANRYAGASLRILLDGIAHSNPLHGGARKGDFADSAIIERIGVSLENLFDQQDLRYYSQSTLALSWNRTW